LKRRLDIVLEDCGHDNACSNEKEEKCTEYDQKPFQYFVHFCSRLFFCNEAANLQNGMLLAALTRPEFPEM
jgi:hypothetical protein